MKYHIIYKVTNIITNKFYVGMHTTKNLHDGYLGSGKIIKSSVKKYGKENHKLEILEFCENREQLIQREKEIITAEFISQPFCMNLQLGGTSLWQYIFDLRKVDKEFDEKLRKVSVENIKKAHIGRTNYDTFSGRSHTEETKQKMRKPKGLGEANSQFGTYWITNGKENKKTKDLIIPDGWYKGRKIINDKK